MWEIFREETRNIYDTTFKHEAIKIKLRNNPLTRQW